MNVVFGATDAVRAVCRDPHVAAVSVTGSIGTGRAVAAFAADAMKPLQAELGGNNAAIVLADADLDRVVPDLVRAAFVFGGQRCTAIRRFVVERPVAARFAALAVDAVRALVIGDPDDAATDVGPLVSVEHRARVLATLAGARADGARLLVGGTVPATLTDGAWLAPALVADAVRESAIVQEETFGPVAVVQGGGRPSSMRSPSRTTSHTGLRASIPATRRACARAGGRRSRHGAARVRPARGAPTRAVLGGKASGLGRRSTACGTRRSHEEDAGRL